MTRRAPFAAALVVAALSSSAWAHQWTFDGAQIQPQAPNATEALAGYTEVYEAQATVGRTLTLSIKDTVGCKAKILMVGTPTGTSAAVMPQGADALTFDRDFKVKATAPGTTYATITVQGQDVVNSTNGPCLENSKNLLRVVVTDDPLKAEFDFAKGWKPYSLSMHDAFKMNFGVAASEFRTTLGGFKAGTIDAETTAMSLYDSAFKGLYTNQDSIGTALQSYRTFGIGRLTQGQFPSSCEPRGFGAGSGGGWDIALRDSYLSGFGGLRSIDGLMLSARAQFDHQTAIGHQNALLTYQPGYLQIPTYTPPSQNPEPGSKSRNDLQIQMFGGLSFQNGTNVESCFWAGGRFDHTIGVPSVTVTPSVGASITKAATAGSVTDTWTARFDMLQPGLTYRMNVSYPDNSRNESCVLSMPWLEAKPGFTPFKESVEGK
jgi:hypothetical protein